jgi:hypothetical protein
MALTNFGVVDEHSDPANSVLITCYDSRQMVLVFISREAVDDYFRATRLTPQQRNLLIFNNLSKIEPVIGGKYDRGEFTTHIGTGGQQFPRIDLTLADLGQATEKLTDSVLDIAAVAGFQPARLPFETNENSADAAQAGARRSVKARGAVLAAVGTPAPPAGVIAPTPRKRRSAGVHLYEPDVRLSLAQQLRWLKSAGLPENQAKDRLERAFRSRQLRFEPVFASAYDDAEINWKTGQVVLTRHRLPHQRFVPTLLASEFFTYIQPGAPLSDPTDPEDFNEFAFIQFVWMSAGAMGSGTEQRPAAYRFTLRDGQIDIVPERPETLDDGVALDTYRELVAKARELRDRLAGTNSAQRASRSVERLLDALGARFEEVRPGLLLSRIRSIEADHAAFSDELSADAIATYADALQSGRDLLACFPVVRRIEAEGLALHLDRNTDAIPAILVQMDAVKRAAAQSEAVTHEVISALAQNDAAIEDATDVVVRTGLVADKLLVVRNFVAAAISGIASHGRSALGKAGTELSELGSDVWEKIRVGLPKGAGATAALVPPTALVGLAVWLGGPVTGIAVTVTAFKPMARILKSLARDKKPVKDVSAREAKGAGRRSPVRRGRSDYPV